MNMGGVFLTVNAGSSSLKVAVFKADQLDTPIASVSIEGIGTDQSCIIPDGDYGTDKTQFLPITSAAAAAEAIEAWLSEELSIKASGIHAIGHRIVHGGDKLSSATRITDEVRAYLSSISPLAPNHMPAALTIIDAFAQTYPTTQQVACFDTGFFTAIPDVAKTLPLPKALTLRRFGFHGLSYSSLLRNFNAHEGEVAAHGRIIMAHLGSGASVCAVKQGQPIDMTMGFTPISGIMMSTRTGDLEPGVLTYLATEKGYSLDEITELVSKKSGLLGVSDLSPDMHVLLEAQETNSDAKLAIDLFCYKVKKQIGAYAAALGGVDSIIFSGGIGERSAEIRKRICTDLGFLGIIIDETRNEANNRLISADTSGVGVHVIPAKEDVSIVTQTHALLFEGAS